MIPQGCLLLRTKCPEAEMCLPKVLTRLCESNKMFFAYPDVCTTLFQYNRNSLSHIEALLVSDASSVLQTLPQYLNVGVEGNRP